MHIFSIGLLLTLAAVGGCTGGTGTTPAGGDQANGGDPANGGQGNGDGNGAGNGNAGGTGGRCKATGAVCAMFTAPKGFRFTTVTSYTAGAEPKISSMSGTAVFTAEGTFVEDYTIGSLGYTNHYEGAYTLDGRFLTGKDQDGNPIEYIVACDEPTKAVALTIPNEDCTPSIIMGLKLVE